MVQALKKKGRLQEQISTEIRQISSSTIQMVNTKKLNSMRLKKIEIVFGTKKFLIRMRNQMTF